MPAMEANDQREPLRHLSDQHVPPWLHRGAWVLMLLIASLWLIGALIPNPPSSPSIHWGEVSRTWLTPTPVMVEGQTDATSLPDQWTSSGHPQSGAARYTVLFDWAPSGAVETHEMWALRFQDISHEHRLWLNGHLLSDNTTQRREGDAMSSLLINVAPTLLHQGQNRLVIEVWHTAQGGLSAPSLAPKSDTWPAHLWQEVFHRHALLAVNLTSFSFSTFVLFLWWVRRQEVAAGLFGLLIGVAFARNVSHFVLEDFGIPNALSSWLFFMAHTVTAVTQGWLVMHITGRHPVWLRRALITISLTVPLMSLLTLPWDPGLVVTRNTLQPILIGLMLPTLWLLWQARRQFQLEPLLLALMVGAFIILVSGLHDFIMLRVVGDISARNWLIWAIPTIMPAFSAMLLARVVQAFDQLEHLNQSLEQQVVERTRELEQANLAKSRFLAAASHDLRQPVAAIGLMTELLGQRAQTPEQQGLTQRLSEAVISMENQLKGLLDLSRLDAGDVAVRPQRVNVSALCQGILSHEHMTARDKGLRLRARIPAHLHAWTDPVLLEQVLRNLVGNAVRHTRRGGVLVGARVRGDKLRLEVWDTGPGIAQADQRRVFDEFVQISSGPSAGRGLGLGLAIARRAAILLGARLSLRSRLGKGSCFSLEVPRAPGAPSQTSSDERSHEKTQTTLTPTGRLLLVEDEAPLRQALVLLLESWGWQVDAHASLRDVQRHAKGPWQLLISDHRLPDGVGRDVLAWARAQQPRLPAMVITGDTAPEQLQALASLEVPVLHKPFRPEKMRAMIEETMALGT